MSNEAVLLAKDGCPVTRCPACSMRFEPFLREQVGGPWWRSILGLPNFCLICRDCKKVVGYE